MYHRRLSIIIVIITCCFASGVYASDASSSKNVWDIINGNRESDIARVLVDAVQNPQSPLARAYLVRVALKPYFYNGLGLTFAVNTRIKNISRVSDLRNEDLDLDNLSLVAGVASIKDTQGMCGAIALGYESGMFTPSGADWEKNYREALKKHLRQEAIDAGLRIAEQKRRLAEIRKAQSEVTTVDLLSFKD